VPGVGKDADHVGAAFDLFVETLQRIGAPDLLPVQDREIGEGGDVVGGRAQHGFDLGQLAAEHVRDGVELLTDMLGAGLGENGADRCGDHLGRSLGHLGEHVAQEMDSASLPSCPDVGGHPGGNDYRLRHHPVVDPSFAVGGIQEHIREALLGQRPVTKRF
jgi:hypothetical protein